MLITKLNKFRQLSWRDRGRLFQSILLLPIIHSALLVLGYSRLRTVMEILMPLKSIRAPRSETGIISQARGIAQIVSIAAQHGLYKATCLRKSILVWWFLRKEGVPSRICFGVRKIDHQLEAHAWVECGGTVVNDSADVREFYQPLVDVLPPTQWGL